MQIQRKWATPLTIGTFVLSAVTGVLMFFHINTELNKLAHEWLGWAMVGAVALHAAINWNAFKRHFTTGVGRTLIGVFVLLTTLSFLPLGNQGGGNPVRLTMEFVTAAPISTLATLSGKDTELLYKELRAVGFTVDSAQQSLNELTGDDRDDQARALSVVFGERPI